MSMTCSARTIEVYEQKDGSNSYVSTARGKPSASAGLYKHDITLPNAQKVVLRLLSLQQPGSAVLHSLQLLPLPPNATQNETARTKAPSSNSEQQDSQNASSQKTQVAAMLQSMMATG